MSFAELVAATDRAVQGHLGGVAVVYTPELGDPVEVQGMFDAEYRLADPSDPGAEQTMPAVVLRREDLPVDPEDDRPTLTIAGQDYSVRERQPDGMGAVRLLLHEVA